MALNVDLKVPSDPAIRAKMLLEQFLLLKDGTDVAISCGEANGQAAIIVTMDGIHHGFFAPEAKKIATALEEAMNKYPNSSAAHLVPNLIMGLRAAADTSEQLMEKRNEDHRGNEARQSEQGKDRRPAV